MDDKLTVVNEEQFDNVSDLHDKMKKLQKHQAFEAEIVANTDRIKNIKQVSSCSSDIVYAFFSTSVIFARSIYMFSLFIISINEKVCS